MCEVCGKIFKSESSLNGHINKVHKGKVSKDYPKTECYICGKLIVNNCLQKHIDKHIRLNDSSDMSRIRYKVDHDDLFCKFCKKECKNKK